MPEIDLGPVIGPQGPKGDTGPQGEQGPQGPQGPAGKFDMDAGLTFTEASARANINSGESLKTILGKIKKYFTDLKPHAFKAPANNFTTTDATTAAAAPTVKQLKEDVDELNSALEYERTNGFNYYLCRIGNVKFYNYSGAIPEKWTGNLQFQMRDVLPVAFRPKNAVSTGVVLRSGVTGILDISTSGIIKLNPSEDIPQGNWVMFSVCYI